ncbi:protein GFS12 isoform X1 [Cucurbita maxima]|uniref:Protein GFS12 isoform X1 n=1 Tax=Cucurbita maxima TaxID=3661 RepID=A0A6J1KE43_CUCMA|nr:protein GFS12 isoform X1 [Cucurbita maxima]
MEEQSRFCFECLKGRIRVDFSDRLIVSYSISDTALPFTSTAVVQVSNGETSGSQFMIVYLPGHDYNCITNYVNEYLLDNFNSGNEDTKSQISEDQVETQGDSPHKGFLYSPQIGEKSLTDGSNYNHSSRLSCSRIISSLAPIARISISSLSTFDEIASNLLSGSLEDHILHSLCLLIEGRASGRDSINFLSLVGIPSFQETVFLNCLRHPNIVPVLSMLRTHGYTNAILPTTPYTLENILHYSPDAIKSEWHIRFLLYQLLSALAFIHGLGIFHGNICPSSVMLNEMCWSWLQICDMPGLVCDLTRKEKKCSMATSGQVHCCAKDCSSKALYADLSVTSSIDWPSDFMRWWRGELSNFEYLLALNRLAGRRWDDHKFHTIMPWVIDFSTKPDESSDVGWRDLSKSKWRLAKGDEQLDFTYTTSEIPHHVSDECLSELAVCSYKARRLPLSILRMAVRSVYEPNEYPSNMQRLYQWTPDECIPEFYCDSQIFYSMHDGMADLAVPPWAGSPEEFIKLHRVSLESDRVSEKLHEWIDVTFGYKMSGEAAIAAKNVMLPLSEPTLPRSMGRRQLFSRPHPKRKVPTKRSCQSPVMSVENQCHASEAEDKDIIMSEISYLEELEEASSFLEEARHLNAVYGYYAKKLEDMTSKEVLSAESFNKCLTNTSDIFVQHEFRTNITLSYLLEHVEVEGKDSIGYQDLLSWRERISQLQFSDGAANDIFSIGCILAELHLRRPLFHSTSLTMYLESGILPGFMQELPPDIKILVEACIQKDLTRRPSAKNILESPCFPATIKSCYLFLAPLQILAKDVTRLRYAANFAKQGALKAMGEFAAEMCAPYCLPLILAPQSDAEVEWAYVLLKEFLKCLMSKAVKTLVLPVIQKILQVPGYSHLKVSLLQDSFVREIWNRLGKQVYMETIHPLVVSNLSVAPHKSSAAAASVLLIGSCEELGMPVTINQTILPLINCFGKGICADGIDALVRIGGLFGDIFVVKQMLPLLKNVVRCCIKFFSLSKPEPMQSWSSLALIDCFTTLDGIVAYLPGEVVLKELIEGQKCLHVMVLIQKNLDVSVLQVAASSLMTVCQLIGPDMIALHLIPQLREVFDELAFSQEAAYRSTSLGKSMKVSGPSSDGDVPNEGRMDLVLILYPTFASILGIEKLRQCCTTWLLLEQYLLRYHHWKWECTGESSRSSSDKLMSKKTEFSKGSTSEYSPAKLLLNGVGWSIPQSQRAQGAKNLMPLRRLHDVHQGSMQMHASICHSIQLEPWFWLPSIASSWDGPDFLGRAVGLKEELPWKIKASVIYSVRAHHGAVRSLAICPDEFNVFTAGIGSGFKGMVQRWELSGVNCVSGYYGHEEVVNDICVLSPTGRIASCDGTIHVWNSRSGKLISVFAESSVDSAHLASPLSSVLKTNADHANSISSNSLSNGILTSAFDGSLYTYMHHIEFAEKLVVGTGNGSLRFIDVSQGQKLHLWRGDGVESGFPSLVSTICSCGFDKMVADGASAMPSWIAAGLSSGYCRLFDARSGNVIATWRAHDGYVTKLAAPEDHMLVSSSLDRTLRIWDLRRLSPSTPIILRGHNDGVSSFSMWGQDVISISRNKIGLSSLSKSADEDGQYRIIPQNLSSVDQGTRNLSVLSSISILRYSRLFVVGTEDGYMKICC